MWLGLRGAGGVAAQLVNEGVHRLFDLPPEVGPVQAENGVGSHETARGPLRILSWNIQFAAGREQEFFYDGGPAVSVPKDTVESTLSAMAEVIRSADPDVVVLQEVDRHSRRTAFVDQHSRLLDALGYPSHCSTPYFRNRYVPYPSQEHLGRVDMHLSLFSRVRIPSATRYPLTRLSESRARRLFNLRRALLEVRLPLSSGDELCLYNTHLSAFSFGDGTLDRQVAELRSQLDLDEAVGRPWVLFGDLNSLPPGDDPGRLGTDSALYAETTTPISPLFRHFRTPVAAPEMLASRRWRTYLPFGASAPDRTIDYVFHGRQADIHDLEVLHEARDLSDHLPLLCTLEPRS